MNTGSSGRAAKSEWFFEPPSRLRSAATWTVCRTATALQTVFGNRCSAGFGVLMYHRVAENVRGVQPPTINVTPEQLRRQLAGLLELGFECWSLSRLVAAHHQHQPVPSNVFAITFDDGFENNYLRAWPILRELHLPATIFVATKYLDTEQPFPFDDWPATGSSSVPTSAWRPLSTRQCREMLEGGLIEIGAHTHSHEKFLGRCSDFRRDMELCLQVLRDRFEIERPAFAFPYGFKSRELVDASKQLGVCCALSTRARRVRPGDDPYEWGRLWADANDSATMLAAKLCWHAAIADAAKPLAAALAVWDHAAVRKRARRQTNATTAEIRQARKESVVP